jgi:hypothetical protein
MGRVTSFSNRADCHTRQRAIESDGAGQHRTVPALVENVVNLDRDSSSWTLERAIARFVEAYNHRRYHESPQNVQLYCGR